MPRETLFPQELVYYLSTIRNEWRSNPIYFGGSSGSNGGTGGPPGGFIGQLPQRQVAGDTTETSVYTDAIGSLMDNLARMRAWSEPAKSFWADTIEEARLYIGDGIWYFEDGEAPVVFTGGSTPLISPPVSGERYDLLTLNKNLEMAWISSAEGSPPAELPAFPSAISNQIPLWMVLSRSSGSVIKRYDDGVSHYIYRDCRPFIGAPTYTPTSGSSLVAYRWYIDGPLSAATNFNGVYYVPDTYDLIGAFAWVDSAPTTGSVIVDIQYSVNSGSTWASVFTEQPSIFVSNYDLQATQSLSLAGGTLLKANLDQAGSGAEGLSLILYGSIRAASGGGTVTSVSVNATDGIIGSVVNQTTTPVVTLSLGDITPDSVTSSGSIFGANLTGTNTGDQTITLTGDVTGTGQTSIATTLSSTGVVPGSYFNTNLTVGLDGRITSASSGSFGGIYQFPPEDVGPTSTQGVSDYASPGDHVHRGVSSVSAPGGSYAYGNIVLSGGTDITVTQTSGSFVLAYSGTGGVTFATIEEARAGTLTNVAVDPAGLPLRIVNNSIIFNQPYGGNARGAYSIDLQTSRASADQVVSGDYSVIVGGYDNKTSGSYNVVLGGNSNDVGGVVNTVINSAGNIIGDVGNVVIIGGAENTSTRGAATFINSQGAYSNSGCGVYHGYADRFSSIAQAMVAVVSNRINHTTGGWYDINNTGMFLLCLPDNSYRTFDILVSAIEGDSTTPGNKASYRIVGAAVNIAGTVSILSQSVTVIYEDVAAWDVQVVAGTSPYENQMIIQGMDGDATATIKWVAVVTACEAGFPNV